MAGLPDLTTLSDDDLSYRARLQTSGGRSLFDQVDVEALTAISAAKATPEGRA